MHMKGGLLLWYLPKIATLELQAVKVDKDWEENPWILRLYDPHDFHGVSVQEVYYQGTNGGK